MKRFLGILLLVFIISLCSSGLAQIPAKGFFLGGSATGLLINGSGEIENEDYNVTDDLFEMDVTETTWDFEVEWTRPGMGWGSKLLYGIKPVLGYRLSPQLAIIGSYSIYMTKKSEQSESVTGHGNFDDLTVTTDAEGEYTHRSIQILTQYHLTPGKEFFLIGGLEFVSMKVDLKYTYSDTWVPGSYTDSFDGEDKASGLVVGAGIEKPMTSKKNMSFIASAMYSFAKYDGDELIEDGSQGIDVEMGVGGFMANVGIRLYMNNEQSAE